MFENLNTFGLVSDIYEIGNTCCVNSKQNDAAFTIAVVLVEAL